MILKFKDKRDILMISTKHDDELSVTNKPKIIDDYNQGIGLAHK